MLYYLIYGIKRIKRWEIKPACISKYRMFHKICLLSLITTWLKCYSVTQFVTDDSFSAYLQTVLPVTEVRNITILKQVTFRNWIIKRSNCTIHVHVWLKGHTFIFECEFIIHWGLQLGLFCPLPEDSWCNTTVGPDGKFTRRCKSWRFQFFFF